MHLESQFHSSHESDVSSSKESRRLVNRRDFTCYYYYYYYYYKCHGLQCCHHTVVGAL